jgi:hypothetical protein
LTIEGDSYQVPLELLKLYQDTVTRRAIAEVVSPVKEEGIDRFTIRDNNRAVLDVTKDDLYAYEAPESQELLLDETRRHAFSIVSLAFKEDNKWRLTDGQNTFNVSMKDDAFQRRVSNNQIAFAKNDVLVCDLRTIQWQVNNGVKTEYKVVKVVNYLPARQLTLFNEEADLLEE